jgi:hypothetical protein
MKDSLSRSATCLIAVGLLSCGGSLTGPQSSVDLTTTLASASPPAGSTVVLDLDDHGTLTAPVSVSFSLVGSSAHLATVFVYFETADGKSCARGGSDITTSHETGPDHWTLTADGASWNIQANCPSPTTTSALDVEVFSVFGETLQTLQFPLSYKFVAPKPPGGHVPACIALDINTERGSPGSETPGSACWTLHAPTGGHISKDWTGQCKHAGSTSVQVGILTCSENASTACSTSGGLACAYCPGPFCP